jgi:dienelactone hydrolase
MYDYLKWCVNREESSLSFPRSSSEWERQKRRIRKELRNSLGLDPWPKRNPLNAASVEILKRDGYSVEKAVLETRDSFLMNALIYKPSSPKRERLPAVLNTVGHWPDSKSQEVVQARCIGQAKNGFIAMTYDPIQQGERVGLGMLHDLEANANLCGASVAGIIFWDGIRAIDYLLSRDDVDGTRLGITGESGGGLQALYIAALDDRIVVSIPCVNLYTFDSLVRSRIDGRKGPGCVCSYVPGILGYATLPYIYGMFAPKPMLILVATRDEIFDINGARRGYDLVRRFYGLYGREEELSYKEFDCGHDYGREMRNELYQFLSRKACGCSSRFIETDSEGELRIEARDRLYVFKHGLLPEASRTVFDITREVNRKLDAKRKRDVPRSKSELKAFQQNKRRVLKSLLGWADTKIKLDARVEPARKEWFYAVSRVKISVSPLLCISIKIFRPAGRHHKCALMVIDNTELEFYEYNAKILQYLHHGYMVILPELRGNSLEETGDPVLQEHIRRDTLILSRSILSMRVEDVTCTIEYVAQNEGIEGIECYAKGYKGSLIALLVTALSERIGRLTLDGCLISLSSLVENRVNPDLDIVIPGILRHVDLPDLMLLVFPRPVEICNAVKTVPSRIDLRDYNVSERYMELIEHKEPGYRKATTEESSSAYSVVAGFYKKYGLVHDFQVS